MATYFVSFEYNLTGSIYVEPVSLPLTMWRVFREVDGVEKLYGSHYATSDEAAAAARVRNEREEAAK